MLHCGRKHATANRSVSTTFASKTDCVLLSVYLSIFIKFPLQAWTRILQMLCAQVNSHCDFRKYHKIDFPPFCNFHGSFSRSISVSTSPASFSLASMEISLHIWLCANTPFSFSVFFCSRCVKRQKNSKKHIMLAVTVYALILYASLHFSPMYCFVFDTNV